MGQYIITCVLPLLELGDCKGEVRQRRVDKPDCGDMKNTVSMYKYWLAQQKISSPALMIAAQLYQFIDTYATVMGAARSATVAKPPFCDCNTVQTKWS